MASWKHALITGGAGFIGSHLARALLETGLEVTILDNMTVGTRDRVPEGATLIEGDVRDPEKMNPALEGVDVVFHEAARVSIRSSVEGFHDDCDNNIMGTASVLNACAKSKVKKLVYASSMAIYADSETKTPMDETHRTEPISPYGISKLTGEQYCLLMGPKMGIDTIALRYFNTYGPAQTYTPYVGVITIFINKLLNGEPPTIFGDGNQMRDYVYVGDIVQANLCALRADLRSGVFNVGTGIETPVTKIAQLLCSRIRPDLQPVHAEAVPEELTHSVANITQAQTVLGYKPQGILEEKIDTVIEAIRQGR